MFGNKIEKALTTLKVAAREGTLSKEQLSEMDELIALARSTRPVIDNTLTSGAKAKETDEDRELSPEQKGQILDALKARFEAPKNKKLRETVDFADVEKSLSAENLYTLHKLEETGGEPQVIGLDGDEFVFEDRSKESPAGRRDLDADQSAAQAKEFGSDMQSPEAYKAMQKEGEYDLESASWLKTSAAHRKETGRAMRGDRDVGGVYVDEHYAEYHFPILGWRASLRVKKV